MEEVHEVGGAWPHFAHQIASLCVLYEYIPLEPFCVRVTSDLNPSVYNGHVVIAVRNACHIFERESFLIDGEIFSYVHVVDI